MLQFSDTNSKPDLPGLTMSAIDEEDFEQRDLPELERGRILAAGEYRREHQQQQQKNKSPRELEEQEKRWR